MRHFVFTASALLVSSLTYLSSPAEARQRVSLEAAEQICLKEAKRFATSSFGRDYGTPPPDIIDHRYRICVYAKSGQNPQRRLKIRGFDLNLVGRG